MSLYHPFLTDHYQNPRNKGSLVTPDFDSGSCNPSCGDTIRMQGVIAQNSIKIVRFNGSGCMLSQAAGSILSEYALGKTIDHLLSLDKKSMLSMLQITLGPTRQACAHLPLQALQEGLDTLVAREGDKDAQSRKSCTKITCHQ